MIHRTSTRCSQALQGDKRCHQVLNARDYLHMTRERKGKNRQRKTPKDINSKLDCGRHADAHLRFATASKSSVPSIPLAELGRSRLSWTTCFIPDSAAAPPLAGLPSSPAVSADVNSDADLREDSIPDTPLVHELIAIGLPSRLVLPKRTTFVGRGLSSRLCDLRARFFRSLASYMTAQIVSPPAPAPGDNDSFKHSHAPAESLTPVEAATATFRAPSLESRQSAATLG